MATVTKPIALDESINTTEVSPRNVADVLAQELANIATAIGGGGGSGGHTIENSSGTALPQRTNLQFGSGLGVTDDAVNDATVVELTGESVHANMFVKLWENPNPSSAFVAQDITLSSSDYDFLLFNYKYIATDIMALSQITRKGEHAILDFAQSTSAGARAWTRRINYTSDTVMSALGAEYATGTTPAVAANNYMVPTVIYGFKKSLDITAIVSNVSTDATRCIMSDGVTNVEDAVEEKARKTDIATVESGSTASRAYSVGELVYVNGNLYKVITAISLGSAFTVGTNIQATNVSSRFADFEKTTLGGAVNITETLYTATTDGYLEFSRGSTETLWRINGTIAYRLAPITGNTDIFLNYLKKGMSINRASGNGVAKFYPLN